MNHKIKFFPLKRNGEIAKTPSYFDSLDKEFSYPFCGRSRYDVTSLYELYLEILKSNEDITDQLFVGSVPISNEQFKRVLTNHTDRFRQKQILPEITRLQWRQEELTNKHASSISSLKYCADEMQDVINDYKDITKKLRLLETNKLMYVTNPEEWNENHHSFDTVIKDIDPISAAGLLDNENTKRYI